MINAILKTSGYIAGILFMISGSMLDSDIWIPFYICVLASGAWIVFLAFVYGVFTKNYILED